MPRFTLVAIDETSDWVEHVTNTAGRIYTQYVYDPEEQTNCAEITPSYYLHPLRYQTELEISDHIQDEMDAVLAWADGIYVHCHQIDGLPDSQKAVGEFDDLEEAMDYWLGNHQDFPFAERKEG
jgi:hypothetical protein